MLYKAVLVRFLQRNKTNRMCVCVCVCVKEIYFKELAHTIMEGKSQDLQGELGQLGNPPELMV